MKTLSRCFLFTFLGGLTFVLLVRAQDQTGFISLDCGLPANSSGYIESTTTIKYISDAAYINSGESKTISPKYKAGYQKQVWTLRSFPQGTRNCYNIRISNGIRYLIGASFLYGNYDGLGKLPTFDIYFGDSLWSRVSFTDEGITFDIELIHLPTANEVHICLINIGQGIPFISSLEFKPLPNNTYVAEFTSLSTVHRLDFGSTTNKGYRFPDDVHDRYWSPYNDDKEYTKISTPLKIDADSELHNNYHPASAVMGTAVTGINSSKPIEYSWNSEDEKTQYHVYFHFAEVVKLQPNQTRGLNITHNGQLWYGPLSPDYLYTTTILSTEALPTNTRHELSFVKIESSTLPPIINALEIYSVIEIFELRSNQEDEDTIRNIKSSYGVIKDWEGDPCVPKTYPWSGLGCNNETTPRIISLNLSSSALTGAIYPYISNLTMLQTLDLSNNNLKGEVPDSLSNLRNLKILKLDNNKLTGQIPHELIKRSNNGSLLLSVKGNPNLLTCALGPCTKKKSFVVPVVASVGGLLGLVIIAAIIFWISTTKIKQKNTLEIRNRQFTYSEVVRMTNNFERILGKGGFGKVYYGVVDDIQVAVKMLSQSANEGYSQFEAEVSILMRVHHKNLTSLVGYLNKGTHRGLIYEYMANGDLAQYLSDKSSSRRDLSWPDRLLIAIDAAQGLEYLHDCCKPPIVHRDVKTSNILLTENFNARLADFGLSRSFPKEGQTHISTMVVAGTLGYLDPEYYTSHRLTKKSDVYSFGVVLLEIISCKAAITKTDEENVHISQWVKSMIAKGDIDGTVDQRLEGKYDVDSVWKAVDIALNCLSQSSVARPTMSQVVAELKNCLAIENRAPDLNKSVDMMSIGISFNESTPLAR